MVAPGGDDDVLRCLRQVAGLACLHDVGAWRQVGADFVDAPGGRPIRWRWRRYRRGWNGRKGRTSRHATPRGPVLTRGAGETGSSLGGMVHELATTARLLVPEPEAREWSERARRRFSGGTGIPPARLSPRAPAHRSGDGKAHGAKRHTPACPAQRSRSAPFVYFQPSCSAISHKIALYAMVWAVLLEGRIRTP